MKKLLTSFLILIFLLISGGSFAQVSPPIYIYPEDGYLVPVNDSWTIGSTSVPMAMGTTTINGIEYYWPSSHGTGECLSDDGSGNLSWVACSGGSGSSEWTTSTDGIYYDSGDVIINDTSTATDAFWYDSTNDILYLNELELNIAITNDDIASSTEYLQDTTYSAGTLLDLDGTTFNVNDDLSQYDNVTSGFATSGSTVAKADALSSNPSNCPAGMSPLGIAADGDVEGCFDVWTESENTDAGYISSETDPIWNASSGDYVAWADASTTNWDTAYSWGDHSGEGYLIDITGESIGDLSNVNITTPSNDQALLYEDGTWVNSTLPSGVTNFTGLSDTPGTYTDQAGKVVKVNGAEDALIFEEDTDTTYTAGTGLELDGTEFNNTDTGSSAVSTHESTYNHDNFLTNIESESIGDLNDVDLTGIANDKVLKYDSTSENWEIADDDDTTYVSSDFDHNQLTNYSADEHRTINDSGTGVTDLWSASKIDTELGDKADSSDLHDAVTLDTTSYDYLSLAGQQITLGQIDISDDTNLATSSGITLTGDTLGWDSTGLDWEGNDIPDDKIASSTEYLENTTYSAGGTLLDLTSEVFSINEGTLTNNKYCTYVDGTGIVCNSDDSDTQLTQEEVEDYAGAMVDSNTETLITVTYQDGDGTLDFVVEDDLSQYDNSISSFLTESPFGAAIDASELASADFGSFTCDGSNCWLDDDSVTSSIIATGAVGDDAIDYTSVTLADFTDDINNATTGVTTLSSLTSIGTIGTGVWEGTAIDDAYIASSTEYLADEDTQYSGGDAITINGTTVDFDGGASPSGELGGTWASPTVDSGIHDDEYIELGDVFGGDATGTYDALEVNDLTIASEETGSIIYYDGSNWVNLGIGSAGEVLEVSDGGIPEWDTDDTGAGSADTDWEIDGTDMYATDTVDTVGIGTTSPEHTLDVEGDLGVSATSTFTGKVIVTGEQLSVGDQTAQQQGFLNVNLTDTGGQNFIQAIKMYADRDGLPVLYGFNGTAIGANDKNVGLYGWASGATTNLGLLIDSGDAQFDEDMEVSGTSSLATTTIADLTLTNPLDFSDYVNATAGAGITFTDDTISLTNDFGADISEDELASADFGDFTCDGTDQGCSLDSSIVQDSEIDYTAVTLADFTNDAYYATTGELADGCTNCLNETEIEDIYLLNTGDTATGDYNFDSGTLFIDSTNNNVGIGTNSPTAQLHVYESATDTWSNLYSDSGYKSGIKMSERSTGEYGFALYHDGDNNALYLSTIEGDGSIGQDHWKIDRLTDNQGFGGIATPAPAFEFNGVSKSPIDGVGSLSNYAIGIRNSSDTNSQSTGIAFMNQLWDDDNISASIVAERVGDNSQSKLRFYNKQSTVDGVDPVEFLMVDESGNVGIGMTSPSTTLEVDGIIKTTPRASATCDADSEGGIYYDSDDNHFYGCDGTSWVQADNNFESSNFTWTGDHDFSGGDIDLNNDSVDDADINWAGLTDLNAGGEVAWGNLGAGELANDSVLAADIATINAGRSLTWDTSNDEMDADAELYTDTFTMVSEATTTYNGTVKHSLANAITITEIGCTTNVGTTTIQLDERSETTPNTGGTDIMSSALACGTIATTSNFNNSGISAKNWINLDVDSVSGTGSTSTVNITIEYEIND